MYFSSMTFLWAFLPVTLLCYMVLERFGKNAAGTIALLFASLIFYAWGEPVYILLLLASVALNYLFGLVLGMKGLRRRRLALALGVVFKIWIIGFLKYLKFFC